VTAFKRTKAGVTEAIRKVELALSEVKVVERRHKGVVLDRAVVNRDALVRARRRYLHACQTVAALRLKGGYATGETPLALEPHYLLSACRALATLERQLTALEAL